MEIRAPLFKTNKMIKRLLAVLMIFTACSGGGDPILNSLRAPENRIPEYTEARLVGRFDSGKQVFAVEDSTNGVICYMTEKVGYTGLSISCVKK